MLEVLWAKNFTSSWIIAARSKLNGLIFPTFGCVTLAAIFSGGILGLVFLAIGAGLAALMVIGRVLTFVERRGRKLSYQTANLVFENDPSSVLGVNADGGIKYRNPAAKQAFAGSAQRLEDLLATKIARSQRLVSKMHEHALSHGAVTKDISTPSGALSLSVTLAPGPCFYWRIEDLLGSAAPAEVALPTMRVEKPHKIISMNTAMERLLGTRPSSLDRVVSALPVVPGKPVALQSAEGEVEVHLAALEQPNGMQDLIVWPHSSPLTCSTSFDSIPVPLLRVTTTGKIDMANVRARRLLGLKDATTHDFAEVVEGLGRPIHEWIKDVAEERCTGRNEVVRAALPDQDVYLQVTLGRMEEQGKVSVLAVLIDATELKTLESQFVQSQKMQAIGQLAGGVAHDFNNLLTAISGHCDLLLLRHQPGDPNYGDLEQINQNANRAASLVGQLLAFSRKQNMQPELIDLRDTIGELTHLLNRLVGERINLEWRHDPNLPHVRADKRQLEQVLMNLVVNARDAMPSGGTIAIETTTVKMDKPVLRERVEMAAGDYVEVKVIDQGHGIAPDKMQKIFEPFYSTKKPGEGTGLGLSMAYGIVKQSGGFIFADSDVGKGSRFTMYFPAHFTDADTAERPIAVTPKPPVTQDGGHVLLVEDEAPVRAFASRALRLRGYTVTEAACAEDALDLLEDPSFDVDIFVTDVVMPGLDGPTWVAEALKARPEVKVVFVSGYSEESVRHNRQKIPNSTFLPKPFSLSQLTEMVQRQMQ